MLRLGGIVLCGGNSTRMGFPKAWLPFGPEVMLQRVVRLLSEAASPVAVVAARNQELPNLRQETIVAYDERPHCGPLEGLRSGLTALQGHCHAAFVTSCDAPRLAPAFVRGLANLLGDHLLAIPCDDQFCHPLAGIYRLEALAPVEKLLAAHQFRTVLLLEEANAIRIPIECLRIADPDLGTLANLNRPEDYFAALAAEGFHPPQEIAERFDRPFPS